MLLCSVFFPPSVGATEIPLKPRYPLSHKHRMGSPQYATGVYYYYRWIKAMVHFSFVCGSYPLGTSFIFYDGPGKHFNYWSINILQSRHTKALTLKSGDSVQGQIHGNARTNCMRNYCTLKFIPCHMNAIIVETF